MDIITVKVKSIGSDTLAIRVLAPRSLLLRFSIVLFGYARDTGIGTITAYIDAVNHNMQAKVNAEIQITSAIARAAFGAFKSANSDFFKIIQAHVQWYLSNPGSEKATENQSTRPRNLNLNGDSQVDTKPASTS